MSPKVLRTSRGSVEHRKNAAKFPICPLPCLAPVLTWGELKSRLQQMQNQGEGTKSNMRSFGSTVLEVRTTKRS